MPEETWKALLHDINYTPDSPYNLEVLKLLNPQPGEVILDLGCGTGNLTGEIARAGARVYGVDSSPGVIEAAQAAHSEVEFHVCEAHNFSFPFPFDAIFSNASLHREPEAEKVVQRVSEALKPGGRFVAEFAGRGNLRYLFNAIQESLWELLQIEVEHNWYFPSIGEYAGLLEQNGLTAQYAVLFDRLTPLENGTTALRNWLKMFAWRMFEGVPWDMMTPAFERIEYKLKNILLKDGLWYADYRRLQVLAVKEVYPVPVFKPIHNYPELF